MKSMESGDLLSIVILGQETKDKVTPMEAQASIASDSAVKWSPSSEASDIVKSIHAMLHPRNIVLVGATTSRATTPSASGTI